MCTIVHVEEKKKKKFSKWKGARRDPIPTRKGNHLGQVKPELKAKFPHVSPNIPALSRQISVPDPNLRTRSPENYYCCHKDSDVMRTSFTPPARAITFRYLNAITRKSPEYILRTILKIKPCLLKTIIANRLDTPQSTIVRRLDNCILIL